MFGSIEPLGLAEAIGVVGFIAYVANYLMLTFRIIPPAGVAYFCINVCAASMVLTGLTASFNMAAALIQGFWIVISIVGITLRLRERRRLLRGAESATAHVVTSSQEPRAPAGNNPKEIQQLAA